MDLDNSKLDAWKKLNCTLNYKIKGMGYNNMHFSKSKKYLLFFNYLISPFSCKTIKLTIHILSISLGILLFYIIFILYHSNEVL